jgi:hypothetical protein
VDRDRQTVLVAVLEYEGERPPLIAAFRERYGGMPTVSDVLTALPDPADHPVFRIRARN